MNKEIKKYLHDILDCIAAIEIHFSDKKYFSVFQSNRTVRRAVERELEIIGEATNRILKIDPEIQLSSSRSIVGLRNLIAHAYDSVDDAKIWGIIINHLPPLKKEVEEFLKN